MNGGKGCISLVQLPKIDELYAKLQGYKIFSTLDLHSGYYHIGLSHSAKPKTAFVISGMGKSSSTESHLDWPRHQHTFKN